MCQATEHDADHRHANEGGGVHKVGGFIYQGLRHLGDYDKAYPYDLSDNDDILDFSFEQQAAIIQDFYRISEGKPTLRNIGRVTQDISDAPFEPPGKLG